MSVRSFYIWIITACQLFGETFFGNFYPSYRLIIFLLNREFFTTNIFRNFQTFLLKIFLCESSTYAQKWWQQSVYLFILSTCKKKTSKKRVSQSQIKIMTRRSVVTDEGIYNIKWPTISFLSISKANTKCIIFSWLWTVKKTYFSWKNLKENAAKQLT